MSGRRATDAGDTETPGATPPHAGDPAIETLGFDDALEALQRTVSALEAGGQPLEESIALYERGVALHERCTRLLTDAELRVRTLGERAGGAIRPAGTPEQEETGGER